MAGKKNPTLDPLKVAMILMGVRSFDPLVRRLGPDHPNVKKKVNAYFENIERQYDQTTLAWARLKQDTWRPIDVERLLRLRTLSPIQRDELERLLSDLQADPRRARGRSVLDPPKPFAEAFADAWTLGIRLANPAMPAHERRQLYLETPWYGVTSQRLTGGNCVRLCDAGSIRRYHTK